MIIQIVGTNGAGKSTAMRAVMAQAGSVEMRAEGHVLHDLPGVHWPTFVVGRYGEAATSGCDTIRVGDIYTMVAVCAATKFHVLFEGIRVLNQTRGPALVREVVGEVPFHIVLLTTPLGVSLASIDARRAARGDAAFSRSTADIEGNHGRARHYAARMRDAGAHVINASREEAPERILALLRGST